MFTWAWRAAWPQKEFFEGIQNNEKLNILYGLPNSNKKYIPKDETRDTVLYWNVESSKWGDELKWPAWLASSDFNTKVVLAAWGWKLFSKQVQIYLSNLISAHLKNGEYHVISITWVWWATEENIFNWLIKEYLCEDKKSFFEKFPEFNNNEEAYNLFKSLVDDPKKRNNWLHYISHENPEEVNEIIKKNTATVDKTIFKISDKVDELIKIPMAPNSNNAK